MEGAGSEGLHFQRGRLSLGNSLLQEPFKKVTAGEQRFGGVLEQCGGHKEQRDRLVRELIDLLKWKHE